MTSDPNDFKVKELNPKYNSCIYVGSFFKGKGLELIIDISKKYIKFYIYGKSTPYLENKKKDFLKILYLVDICRIIKFPTYFQT